MDMTTSPADIEVRPGERVLWRGQPLASVLFGPEDILFVPFSLMWGGFALFWEASVLGVGSFADGMKNPSHPIPIFFALWGIPFVCAGLYMIVGRFFHLRWLKQHTWYVLTDRRIIIVSEGFSGRSVKEQELKTLTTVERRSRGNHVGTLDFVSPGAVALPRNFNMWPTQKLRNLAFIDIAEVEQVYELLQKARAALS